MENETPIIAFPPSTLAQQYRNAIIEIYDKGKNASLDVSKMDIQCDDMASNKHHFVYEGRVIRRKNKLYLRYGCVTCQRENYISLNNVVNKIDRNKSTCVVCGMLTGETREKEGKNTHDVISTLPTSRLLVEKIKADEQHFWHQNPSFCDQYVQKNMSCADFERIKPFIKSFQNDKFPFSQDEIVYVPYFRNNPTPKCFEPMFYDKKRDMMEKPINVRLVCHLCEYTFLVKSLNPYRKKHHILCKKCEMDNSPTKIKLERNVQGGMVQYKTQFQHKFLKYCLQNDILCVDGLRDIPFALANTPHEMRKASIHYALPHQKVWVDVVGNKEFQPATCTRTQVLNEEAQKVGYRYVQLYPKNYVKLTRYWKRNTLFSSSVEQNHEDGRT